MIDPVFGLVGAAVFIAIGIAYVAFGHTAGEVAGVVLIVPFALWLAVTVRRRRADD